MGVENTGKKAKGEGEISGLQIDCDDRETETVLTMNGVEHMCVYIRNM